MKNCIIRKWCAIFVLLILFSAGFTVTVYAQSGKGGSTEVVAHVALPSVPPAGDTDSAPAESSEDSSKGSSSGGAPDRKPAVNDSDSPVKTGVAVIWFVVSIFILSGGTALAMKAAKDDSDG